MATASPAPATNPTSGARPRRDPARRAAIVRAAAFTFAHAGYAATSMDGIAAEARVSKLVVYRHFASKELLYRSVLEQVFERQAELFLEHISAGLQSGGATRALLTVARENPDGFRLLWRHAAREPQFADYAHHLRDTAMSAARAVVEPHVRADVAEWAAQTLFDHLVDAVLNWIDHGDPAADELFVGLEQQALVATVRAWSGRR
jgi:AcrR family transcriptional regulator